ncbi:MAG: response regulator [Ignavibacteriales bacterium]|nr:response regulator [Ignavibacteriales bacterium]
MALIAVIDDDPDIVETTTMVLKSKGYDVVSASNPDDGYDVIKDESPDLIILDVIMVEPDDGFFLAQRLRRDGIKTPILMYTSISKATGIQYDKNEMIPVDEFLEKPVSPDTLVEKVKALLEKGGA